MSTTIPALLRLCAQADTDTAVRREWRNVCTPEVVAALLRCVQEANKIDTFSGISRDYAKRRTELTVLLRSIADN